MNAPRFHPNCAAQKRHRSNGCNGPARRGFAPALSGGRRGGLPGPLAARRVSGGGPLCMGSTDIRAHVRLNTFAEWTSKTASAAFDIPYHSHLGGASQGAGKVFSQLFAFQRRQRPGACTSALTSGPVSTTIIYGYLLVWLIVNFYTRYASGLALKAAMSTILVVSPTLLTLELLNPIYGTTRTVVFFVTPASGLAS